MSRGGRRQRELASSHRGCVTCALAAGPGAVKELAGTFANTGPRPTLSPAIRAREVAALEQEAPGRRGGRRPPARQARRAMPEVEIDEEPPRDWRDRVRMDRIRRGPTMEELSEEAQERAREEKWGTNIDPRTCTEQNVLVDAEDVGELIDRCTMYIGPHAYYAGRELTVTLPAGYRPSTSKSEMYNEFLDAYMTRKTASWGVLANNIQGSDQAPTLGCFWDDGEGFMSRAVLHALAMIAAAPDMTQLGKTNNELFDDLKATILAGELPIYLRDFGLDGRMAIVVGAH